MKWHRVKAMMLHTWYHFTHSMETWVDLFLHSMIQIAVFSFIAVSLSGSGKSESGLFMIAGMIFWNIIWASQYAIAIGALWEIWARSLSSLLITPLTLDEFLVGQMLSGAIKALASTLIAGIVAYGLYEFTPFLLGVYLPIYFVVLLLFGYAVGMMVLSLIFHKGTDVQSLSWFLVFLVQPFGAVFYPVSVLPLNIRWIAYGLPTTYIFESIRNQLIGTPVNASYLIIGTVLSVIYFVLGYILIKRSYIVTREKGLLARLLM